MAEAASDPYSRARGLSEKDSLAEFSGMLFWFAKDDYHAMWMKGMRFPIDIIWLNRGRVVDIEENVPVPRAGAGNIFLPVYRPDVMARYVLEVNAGFAKRHNLRIGDAVKILWKGEEIVTEAQAVSGNPMEIAAPGGEFFVDTLRDSSIRGNAFRIGQKISETDAYEKFAVFYQTDGLSISGVMNIPKEIPPASGFPVLILNHGLIPPEIYFSGRGSKREQDFFARKGYVTIHPDYRGLASSSPNSAKHHDFYVGYTKDVLALIDALKKFKSKLVDVERLGMWGHSMGGGIAARVMVLDPDIRAYVLFAPISADAEDNFYELFPEEKDWLAETYGTGEDARKIYDQISPLNYFSEVLAPVQLHHGTEDQDVPIDFSEKMFEALQALNKKVEFFTYYGEPHEFVEAWPMAAERSLQFFDKYVKGTR